MSSSSIDTSSCFKLKGEDEAWIQNFLGVCVSYQAKKKKKRMDGFVFLFSVGSSSRHLCTNDHMCVLISPSHVPIDIIVFVTDKIIRAQQLEAPWK